MSPTATLGPPAASVIERAGALPQEPSVADLQELTITAIMHETHAPRDLVESFVRSLVACVGRTAPKQLRKGRSAVWHPSDKWLGLYHDRVFVMAMPDDVSAAPGSAHARLQDLCSEKLGQRVTLTHTRTRRSQATFCALCVRVNGA